MRNKAEKTGRDYMEKTYNFRQGGQGRPYGDTGLTI